MNEKTKYFYYLSQIYEHTIKIDKIVKVYNNDFVKILSDDIPYSSICMHIAQMGEFAR